MASNNFKTLSQTDALAVANQFSAAITANPTTYGLTAANATAFAEDLTKYNNAISASDLANAAAKSATQDKSDAKFDLMDSLASFAKIAYAHPGITSGDLAAAGLAIPATPGATVPQTPTSLVASPSADGDVLLTWNRSGNRYGVSFAVQVRGETGDWSVVAVVTAAKARLSGFTPGVAKWFRVVAVNKGVESTPSLEVSVYHDSAPAELSLAA
jgi:hypothetical protein